MGELYKVSAQEARVQLSDLINKAVYGRQASLITRQGKPAAVLISFEQWQTFQHSVPTVQLPSSDTSSLNEDATPTDLQVNHDARDEQAVDPSSNQ